MTYTEIEVARSQIWFKWSKSRPYYLQTTSIEWTLMSWIVWYLSNNRTMNIHKNTLQIYIKKFTIVYLRRCNYILI